MRIDYAMAAVLWGLLSGCPPASSGGPDGGGAPADGGGAAAPFLVQVLDPAGSAGSFLSLSIFEDRVGVAYFVQGDGGVPASLFDGGSEQVPNWDLRYVEWSAGQAGAPEHLATVQRVYGVSLAFTGAGEPAVAYLGGGSDNSAFWLQSDAVVSYRNGGTWSAHTAAALGTEANCGNPVSDRGFLVGLNPGLVFDGAKAYLAYRDGHQGQFPQQDWAGSDLELAEGGPTAWTKTCLMAGGDNKQAYGGHIQMVMANGQPALVHDKVFGSAEGSGQDVLFLRRLATGAWTQGQLILSIGNTQSGATLGWDPVEGYGVAVVDRSDNRLSYVSSTDGVTWTTPDPVHQSGTGGWYPSLAFDPQHHEPAIAYYHCAHRAGVNEGACPPTEDALFIKQRIADQWREVQVDAEGGYLPKLGFLSSGKRVVAYRDLATGALKLAVER